MSEEVRASVGRSRRGLVRLVEEHTQGGGTRTAFCAHHGLSTRMQAFYRELDGSSLPVAESRVLPVERFPDTAAPTSTEATTGESLWVDLRHSRRIDVGRRWLGYLARFAANAAGVSWATLLIERLSRPGSTSSRYCRTGTPSRRQLSTIEKMAATFGPAFSLPIWIQLRRLSKYFDRRRYVHSRIMYSLPASVRQRAELSTRSSALLASVEDSPRLANCA
jgi:hypothetical protein